MLQKIQIYKIKKKYIFITKAMYFYEFIGLPILKQRLQCNYSVKKKINLNRLKKK